MGRVVRGPARMAAAPSSSWRRAIKAARTGSAGVAKCSVPRIGHGRMTSRDSRAASTAVRVEPGTRAPLAPGHAPGATPGMALHRWRREQ